MANKGYVLKNNKSNTQSKKNNISSAGDFLVSEQSVRKLAELLNETQLTEIEYQVGEHRIRVARQSHGGHASALPHSPVAPIATSAPAPSPLASAPAQESAVAPKGEAIKAPMVGTVYLSAEPGAAPFIKVGDVVAKGATLLIIEAMKVMNPIRSPRDGRVIEICIGDANPVEFGEALVIIE